MLARCLVLWLQRTFRAIPSTARRRRFRPCLENLESRITPVSVNLSPSADDTLYQDPNGQLSNGAGQHFYAGATLQSANFIRRGALKFNLAAIPAGSIVQSATLTLNMSKTISGPATVALHPALKNWGEGASNAALGGTGPGEGDGVQATAGDVTWLFTFFSSQRWSNAGGDFGPVSAATSVGSVGSYQWTGAGVIADVQAWVNDPAANFGWIITGDEATKASAKQFDTKEDVNPSARPLLTVDYTLPNPDLVIAKSHIGSFHNGDPADRYSLLVRNIGFGPTSGTVTVTDTLPAGLTPTAANSGIVNGWSVLTSGQTVTATRSDVLGANSSYPALTVIVSVANNAPPSVTNTATVAGGGEVNTANDSAGDTTTITAVADLTISKTHNSNFKEGDNADVYTLTIGNIGLGATAGAVTVTDTLPAGLAPAAVDNGTISGWTLSASGQTITATRADVLAPGASYPALLLTVTVSPTAPANVTNTATVAGGGEVNTANDSAADPTAVTQVADLTITKTHAGTFHPGDAADAYTITVSNVGPTATDGSLVTVVDTLPLGLLPTAADNGTVNGWTLSFSGQTVTATRADILAGGAGYPPLIVTVSVANSVGLLVTNVATVSGGGEVITGNDTASDPTATTPVADLTISKSHAGSFRQGDSADAYTLTVSNIGPLASAGTVSVVDVLPAGLTATAADTGTLSGWTISVSGQTVTATRTDVLASGASYPALVLTVRVANDAPASVTNMATVAGGGELNTTNDTAGDITAVTQVADLTVAAGHTGSFTSGNLNTYTINVRNAGTGATTAPVTVIDILPAGFAYAGPASVNGWMISVVGQTVTATRADALASGASYESLTLTVRVAGNVPAGATNRVTVSGGGEVNTTNDAAADFTTIVPGQQIRRRRGA